MSFDDVTAAPFMVGFFVLRENVSADSHKQKTTINGAAVTSSKDVRT